MYRDRVVEFTALALMAVAVATIPMTPAEAMTPRRYPPPWSVDELEACFVVKDGAGQKLVYVYFEEDLCDG